MSQLPIFSVLPQLIHAIGQYPQIILQAEPGAGKSTQFPLSLLQQRAVKGRVIMLEPRRLAAKNIASFLARQLNERVGETVGYRIKGETNVSRSTQLEIVTEGVLTRMIQSDPELTGVDLVIFDEFHERSLHADTAFAFVMEVQASLRDDLSVVIMSATLDMNALESCLPEACCIRCEGRGFPIEYRYAPLRPNDNLVSHMVRHILHMMATETGSLLAFLPGVASIRAVMTQLEASGALSDDVVICPLYGQLEFADQQKAIQPAEGALRKIVLATNIAETSLTIDGIRMVVDSGLERIARFDSNLAITKLEQTRIAQSSAAQRAGRAGRLEPGICLRLYSETELRQQPATPQAEILHTDLLTLALELAQWGVVHCEDLVWLDMPPAAEMERARQLLLRLDLLDAQYRMTALGREAYALSMDPRLASMIVRAKAKGHEWINAAMAAAVIVDNSDSKNDSLTKQLHEWQANTHPKRSWLNKALVALAARLDRKADIKRVDEDKIALLLALAYPDRIAMHRSGSEAEYLLANGHGAQLSAYPQVSEALYLVVPELMKFSAMNSQVQLAEELNMSLLRETFPELFVKQEVIDWDENSQKMTAEIQVKCGVLIIERQRIAQPDSQKMTQALLKHVQYRGLSVLNWSADVVEWLERIRCAIDWIPEQPWPAMDDQSLLDDVMEWLSPYLIGVTSAKMLSSVPLIEALKVRLGWPLNQQVDEWVPVSYRLPTGSYKKIRYKQGAEPILSVRIQEVFGEKDSPVIAMGKKKLVMELLSPAMRPIQVTQNLSAFWSGSYQEVKKEMKGRYPKHVWPDDPANHVATTKTKRQLNS